MSIPARFFVTGTDTGVGKTVVTASLSAATGIRALKPIASGVKPGTPGDDAALLALATGTRPETLYAWEAPVSPHRAAEERGDQADLAVTLAWIRDHAREPLIVEGVGGWRVPVAWDWDVAELGRALSWPVLIVAANRLGVINHTRMTVEAVIADRVPVLGVVLNSGVERSAEDEPACRSNLRDLRRLLDVPVWSMDRLPGLTRDDLALAGARLVEEAGGVG